MTIDELLKNPESEWLDFKKEWYETNEKLIHDILCLANSDCPSDRYIVIGFDEENKKISSVSSDSNRKNEEDLFDLIKKSHFNIKPNIKLVTEQYEKDELDIIIIKKSYSKPFFLTQDKIGKNNNVQSQSKCKKPFTVRAGVIYTRDGPTNTPIDSTASEYQISKMWQERFGLTQDPRQRFNLYMQDTEKWECRGNDSERLMIYYYKQFPEFTLEYHIPEHMSDYSNPPEKGNYIWMQSIGNSYETELKLKYHTTVLECKTLGLCDKHRYCILHPKVDYLYYNPDDYTDIHVFANDSSVSDRNKTIEEIDYMTGNENYRQIRFCYNIENSENYFLEKILNYADYNGYTEYFYLDSSNNDENKNVKCPSVIYLFNETESIAFQIRKAFLKLQNSNC